MIENILRHFRAPAGVDQSEWKECIRLCLTNPNGLNRDPNAWAYWMSEGGGMDPIDVSKAIEDLCDRFQELTEELEKLRT